MRSLSRRIGRMEKKLEPDGKGRRCAGFDIWDEDFAENWPDLAEWALGETDERPDCWPSEEEEARLRRQGYVIESQEELQEMFKMLRDMERKREAALTRIVGYGV